MDLYENYQELYNLTNEQKKAIEEEDFDKLLEILEEKQEIINNIDEINKAEYLKKQENPGQYLKKLQDIVQKTKELEDENETAVHNKKNKLTFKLKDLNKKQRSRNGYQAVQKYEAKFIDKKR